MNPWATLSSTSRMPRDASVIVILPKVTMETAIALGELRRQGYAITAVINTYEDEDFAHAAGPLLAYGIPTRHLQDEAAVVAIDAATRYYAVNKPSGVVSTMSDEKGRPSLAKYVGEVPERLYHVGRLDTDTEGLILLTNDGELAHRLTHPSFGVTKTYVAEVAGPIARDLGRRLLKGVTLEDGPVKADDFRIVEQSGKRFLVEVRSIASLSHPNVLASTRNAYPTQ